MIRRSTVVALAVAASLVATVATGTAFAETRRFALVIGAATGEPGQDRLEFAEADAERIATILRDVGGFAGEDVVALTTVTAAEVRRAVISFNARLRAVSGDSLLFVFYSGHADAEALQMAGTRLPTAELRDLIYGSPATVRVLVIDACRSGTVTRTKGGRRGPAFAIDVEDQLRSQGVAILTSSADSEDSQESDALRASFFTHYLASGLRGAADGDADHRVTLVEAFTYAAEHTLTATARTRAGPQHPTYRFDLTGREDVVLTWPIANAQRIGTLTFREPGAYIVQQRDAAGPPIAEVDVEGAPRTLALPAGTYHVTRRAADHLLQGRFAIAAARATAVRGADMERIAYAQVVRKGGVAIAHSASVFAAGAARSGLGDVAPGFGGELGARLDLRGAAFELRLQAARFGPRAPGGKVVQAARELNATVVALRALDLRHATVAAGIAVGGFWIDRRRGTDSLLGGPVEQRGAIVGGVGQVQRQLGGPLFVRLELGALGYLSSPPADGPLEATIAWSASLGFGAFL